MCSKESSVSPVPATGAMYPLSEVHQYRLQLYQYAVAAQRLGYPQPAQYLSSADYHPRLALSLLGPRSLAPEEPKPQHSYIGLIAMAILSSPEYKLVLSDIYQYILDHYPYFRTRGPGWRNSIRHNLSLNDCFVKAGRSANGKGHYWAIHPANVEDFKKGDFRRRKAQRKVRKHMGLAVDDDGTDSPSPSPPPPTPSWHRLHPQPTAVRSKKRQFDVASLLAPDPDDSSPSPQHHSRSTVGGSRSDDEELDVVSTPGGGGGGVSATSTTVSTLPAWPYTTFNQHLMARYYQTHC